MCVCVCLCLCVCVCMCVCVCVCVCATTTAPIVQPVFHGPLGMEHCRSCLYNHYESWSEYLPLGQDL